MYNSYKMNVWIAATWLMVADYLSTKAILAAGGYEANPLVVSWVNTFMFPIVKLAVVPIIMGVCLWRDVPYSLYVISIIMVVYIMAVTFNVGQLL